MHRLPGEEIFHHYLGEAVEMLLLHPDGRGEIVRLGKDLDAGERPQVVVPGGVWQGSKLVSRAGAGYALLGCTMAPGFDYADYQHGQREPLVSQYPDHAARIAELTT
jgi:predicted cupin superfamily sugar epimerase